MYFSGRKVGNASRVAVRSLIALIITSIALPLSPAQAEAVSEHVRSTFNSALKSLSKLVIPATGKQDFEMQRTEDPSRNIERVTHFRLYPRRLKLYAGEAYTPNTAGRLTRSKTRSDG